MSLIESSAVLADSSFYLCFLEDIEQPKALIRILDRFGFLITPTVYREVSKSPNFEQIKSHPKLSQVPKENLGEALKPFFSKKQIDKGETEVIELAYQLFTDNKPKLFILDDKEPRMFVIKNLPKLVNLMVGTAGFVGQCYYAYAIFSKNEAKMLVLVISASPFRVSAEVIKEVVSKIESR